MTSGVSVRAASIASAIRDAVHDVHVAASLEEETEAVPHRLMILGQHDA
jgi:hypothetical protein